MINLNRYQTGWGGFYQRIFEKSIPLQSGGLLIVLTGIFSSSPNSFIGDRVFLKKSLDSRSEGQRE
jgi:hypothetical protein